MTSHIWRYERWLLIVVLRYKVGWLGLVVVIMLTSVPFIITTVLLLDAPLLCDQYCAVPDSKRWVRRQAPTP